MALYNVLWQYPCNPVYAKHAINVPSYAAPVTGCCRGRLLTTRRAAVQRHVSEMIFCSRCTTGFHHTRLAMRLTASILFLVINCVHYVFCCLHLTHNTIAPICKVVNYKFVELIVAPLIVGVLLKLFEWWLTH